jgi:hypothetical protein
VPQAYHLLHEHRLVALQRLHLLRQVGGAGGAAKPDLDQLLLRAGQVAAVRGAADAMAAVRCRRRGLAAVDLDQQVAPPAQKVFVGKLPTVGVNLAKALQGRLEMRGSEKNKNEREWKMLSDQKRVNKGGPCMTFGSSAGGEECLSNPAGQGCPEKHGGVLPRSSPAASPK